MVSRLFFFFNKTAQIADTPLEMGISLQEDSRAHQLEIQDPKEQYLILAAAQHQNNLKFRGVEEGMESSTDLICYIGNWLAKVLQLEENIFPVITKAFRLSSKKADRKLPRDIIVIFADVKHRIQNVARKKNSLMHLDFF